MKKFITICLSNYCCLGFCNSCVNLALFSIFSGDLRSYLLVLPYEFLQSLWLISEKIRLITKEISRTKHEYTPLPQVALYRVSLKSPKTIEIDYY